MSSSLEGLFPVDVVFDSALSNNTATQSRDTPGFSLLPGIPNCVGLTVMYAQLAFSYYVSDTTNNTFIVRATLAVPGAAVYRVHLQPGTYTSTSLALMFTAVLDIEYDAARPELGGVEVVSAVPGPAAYTDLGSSGIGLQAFVYDTTSKLTIYISDVPSYAIPFQLDFSESTNCGDLLGFSSAVTGPGTYLGVANTAGKYSSVQAEIYDNNETIIGDTNYIEGPYTVNLTGPPNLYLHSTLSSGLPYGAVRNATANNDIVQDVVVNNNYQGIIMYQNQSPVRIPFSPTTITSASFYWTLGNRTAFSNSGLTAEANYLSLQGQSFQVKIRFYVQLESILAQGMNSGGDNIMRSQAQTQGSRIPFETKFKDPGPGTDRRTKRKRLLSKTDEASGRPRPGPTSYPMRPY